MRGEPKPQLTMLSLRGPEQRVPADHPARRIKALTDAALRELDGVFDEMYEDRGRKSVPPERLLKATLLMALFSLRSERHLCEQLGYNLLFRWFLDMDMVEETFDHSVFAKNRSRLLAHDVAHRFLSAIVATARSEGLLSSEHFTVDGTLIEAWASLKSFKRKADEDDDPKGDARGGRNPEVDFHGERRSNDTHTSTTDPEARLLRKGNGKEAKLCFAGHVLMENRSGLVVDVCVSEANGRCEPLAALALLDRSAYSRHDRAWVAADKGYDTHAFVAGLRDRNLVPHIAAKAKHSALDGRTTRHESYRVSQRVRKRVEEIFGWAKTIGGLRKTRYRGVARTDFFATLVAAAFNLVRIANLRPMLV